MADQTDNPKLWTPRSVADTQKIYADWADSYEDDVTSMAYATPDRIAQALVGVAADTATPVLDFGCGTGLSGMALHRHGFEVIDGTDISPEMLEHARQKTTPAGSLYRRLWLGTPGETGVKTGAYRVIVATGVISLGAAPPTLLADLIEVLALGGLLALSYNDPTLADPAYVWALEEVVADGTVDLVFREHGPHLNAQVTGSDVIVLRRS